MSIRLFCNAVICTPHDSGRPLAGESQGDIRTFSPGALVTKDGMVTHIGPQDQVLRAIGDGCVDARIDCGGQCMVPGFVDPHTHMCFAERREAEFSLRLGGTPYLEILRRGGGILSSVRAVRAASETVLFDNTLTHAQSALKMGTTTLEIKSGYGLNTETELKMLRVIHEVGRQSPLDVVATFLGAHAVPEAYGDHPEAYVDLVVSEMLPAVVAQGIARFCDVFCEKGVFTLAQSRRILTAARAAGLTPKIHADEVHDLGGAGLAADVKAVSAEHLLATHDDHLRAMARAGVLGVLLPATAYSLRKPYARACRMIELGVPLAIASDCNPGSSYTESMPFTIGLAVMNMLLTPAQALSAATLNAAYAIGMARRVGSLDVGKQADFSLLDGASPAILAYHAGVSPVVAVYKKGAQVA